MTPEPIKLTIEEIAEKWALECRNSSLLFMKNMFMGAILEATEQLRKDNEELKKAAGFCDKHQPNGGHRNCLVCACEKLSFALSRISYLLGQPNEMQQSDYDIHETTTSLDRQL